MLISALPSTDKTKSPGIVVRLLHYTVPATGGILVEKNSSIAKSVLMKPHDSSFIMGDVMGCVPRDTVPE